MKILHTSDLHIGKRLHQAELVEEQLLFFQWLTDLIEKEKIDALIISGDIFDVANPSSESRKIYFELLVRLARLNCKLIITGGNHDSPSVLEAPKELLKELDIHVIGSLDEDISSMIIPIHRDNNKPCVVIAAIPYLRDADLRKHSENETYEDRSEAIRSGIINVFSNAAEHCKDVYPNIPAIAMGHIYVQGSYLSESEREIQIGNVAGVEVDKLPGYFQYYALGHLHKPQQPSKIGKVIYSGAPVKMSFSESENKNRVMLLTIEGINIRTASIQVPLYRHLYRLSGTVEELKKMLKEIPENTSMLESFIELDAVEENPDPNKRFELETITDEFNSNYGKIIKCRIRFINQPAGTAELYNIDVNIEDLKPIEVFSKKIENENLDERITELLKEAFNELLEDVRQKEEEK